MVDHNFSLLARMFVVAAIGAGAVGLINRTAPSIVLGDPGDVTAFVVGHVQALAHVSVKLMTVGHDVIAFVFFGA